MKIFALYIKIKLIEEPEWFEEFLKKYFEPVSLHITIIQPRYIDEEQTSTLLAHVKDLVNKFNIQSNEKKVLFENIEIEKSPEGKYTFMLHASDNNLLMRLQKELRVIVKDTYPLVKESHEEYEINFKPHLTIAIDLEETEKKEAEKYLASKYKFEGILDELVLPVVKDQSIEERTNINNHNILKL